MAWNLPKVSNTFHNTESNKDILKFKIIFFQLDISYFPEGEYLHLHIERQQINKNILILSLISFTLPDNELCKRTKREMWILLPNTSKLIMRIHKFSQCFNWNFSTIKMIQLRKESFKGGHLPEIMKYGECFREMDIRHIYWGRWKCE